MSSSQRRTIVNRRAFLADAARAAGGAALLTGALAAGRAYSAPGRKPNVIVIYTDDQGSIDTNLFGANDLVTPNLDALARRGVRFTQFYAPSPVCSPSRAGLMTGRYPVRAGTAGNCPSEEGQPGMPTTEITMAEMLKAAGYATGQVGKWHLGYSPDTMPNAQGFDYSFGHMGGCIDNYSHFFYWRGPNRHDLHENGEEVFRDGEFFPDLMVDAAGRFIEQHRNEPFFLYFAMNQPHYPYQGEADWLAYYREKGVAYPRDLYAAFISTLDERIGALLAKLDELGLREDTIVVFQSDHGHSTEERAHFGGGNAGPYRGAKFSMFEGGIRIPAAISWPGHLPEGEVRGQLGHGCDWLPTIAELCGVAPPDTHLDGVSLAPVVKSADAPSPHGAVHWQMGLGEKAQWAVRDGDWKLIGNPRDTSGKAEITESDKLFLSNLAEDIGEMTNLAGDHPEVVERLRRLHEEWIASM
ncbi:MAG: sulfatase-like hydrolase/transferase [Candidatus Hydrogenedentes bacterium]|nr:sulfatase-like hydrolase/transferase [Candidatus Hydrogenedentota bacterium]